MPRKIEIELFKYDELSERAQERARDWFRESSAGDTFWSESVTDDFAEMLETLGFSVDTRRGTRSERAIYWDTNPIGGAFDSSWSAARCTKERIDALLADRPATWKDSDGKEHTCEQNAELAVIALALLSIAQDYPNAGGSTNTGRYCNMAVEFDTYGDAENVGDATQEELADATAAQFKELCEDLGHYLGRAIDAEWNYRNSDETVAEDIRANEYEFTADGARA